MDNRTVARRLTSLARELSTQPGNLYRVRAYRRAAETVLGLDQPIHSIVSENGRAGLRKLPGIGASISTEIERLVCGGQLDTNKVESAADN